jgi:hypothetical protein
MIKRIIAAVVALCAMTAPAQAVTPWDPIPLTIPSLKAWWDASYTPGVAQVGSVAVQVNDRSGNGEFIGSLAYSDPGYGSSTINGLNTLTFSGAQGMQTNDASFSRFLFPASTVFVLSRWVNDQQNSVLWSAVAGGTIRYNLHIPFLLKNYFDFGDPLHYPQVRLQASTSAGTHIIVALGNYATGALQLNQDGTVQTTGSLAGVPTPTFLCPLVVGQNSGCGTTPTLFFTGLLGEVLVYNTQLTTAQIQYVEGYLACKWGIQSQLPNTHPYHSVCPSYASPFFF